MEQTLAIIKPDAVRKKIVGSIISAIEEHDFTIVRIKTLKMAREEAALFYDLHRGKPFYERLVDFMSSGQIYVLLLERERAIEEWRWLMGVTDPAEAVFGSLRQRFGTSVQQNSVHGSDSPESARRELSFFFGGDQ